MTRRIQEDLMPYLNKIGLPHRTFEPQTADQLLDTLNQIARKASAGLRPVLHFDTHGDETRGIKLAATGEFVPWPQLVGSLRPINVATGNNLCVVSGACYSMNAVTQVRNSLLTEACPFFLLIAPGDEVSSGFLEDNTLAFYKSAFGSLNFVTAHACHLAPNVALFHCERMLAYLLAGYVRDYCIGKGGNERREQLLTKAVGSGLAHNRNDRRRIRQAAKVWTRPSQEMVERFTRKFASTFLMDRPLGFDVADVMKLVKSANDEAASVLAGRQRLSKRR